MASISDLDQITKAAAGDRGAQAALVNRHMDMIFRVAYRMLGDQAEAEDVTQETFLRAWKILPDWQPKAKFSTWACTVALNLCRDRLRKKRPILMDTPPERVDMALRPDERLASAQAIMGIEAHIAALPERQKEALTLSALEGLGNKQAAEVMDITVHALESLLGRARRTLRAALMEQESKD
ncbi:sigma-70 family RNA polymerase sigma factor [Hyphomonas sp. FCG-A18]|uniref:sigma-70 family RNA polymerase sigma factor n=1 Tax=Hyphomonas sp. FCG-A18 TaxID=3080019 RepID=UPI002B2C97F0|nr:sigma-70 family RNA polymerase sigma factor [Hyphomonas sp. FCG-A18]